jgi:hypothetical protein
MDSETNTPRSRFRSSPLKENWSGVAFLLALLLAAGITATVVGYRVKKADWDRKAQLLATYEALGGSFEGLLTPSQTVLNLPLSPEQRTFAAIYEVNQRARDYGVLTVIDNSSRENVKFAITSLEEIGATEASRTFEDTLRALDEAPSGTDRASNTEALRRARQYGRPMSRDTEAKLFKYLDQNRSKVMQRR